MANDPAAFAKGTELVERGEMQWLPTPVVAEAYYGVATARSDTTEQELPEYRRLDPFLNERAKRVSREGIQRRHRCSYTVRRQAHRPTISINTHIQYRVYHMCVATRKNITIRDDQEEWIQENHLNLSRFVQDKLDDLIEERS